jgi:hypothetical protein
VALLASAYLRESGFPRQRLSTGKRPSSPAPIYRKAAFLASAYLRESPRQRLSTGKRFSSPAPIYWKAAFLASAYLVYIPAAPIYRKFVLLPSKYQSPAPLYGKVAFLASAYLRKSNLPHQRLSTGKWPSSPAPIYRKVSFPDQRLSTVKLPSSPALIYGKAVFFANAYLQEGYFPH